MTKKSRAVFEGRPSKFQVAEIGLHESEQGVRYARVVVATRIVSGAAPSINPNGSSEFRCEVTDLDHIVVYLPVEDASILLSFPEDEIAEEVVRNWRNYDLHAPFSPDLIDALGFDEIDAEGINNVIEHEFADDSFDPFSRTMPTEVFDTSGESDEEQVENAVYSIQSVIDGFIRPLSASALPRVRRPQGVEV